MKPVAQLFSALAALAAGAVLGHQTGAPPAVQTKLTNVVFSTTHLDEQIAFYQHTLGFTPFYHDKTSCFLRTGSANLVLVRVAQRTSQTEKLCLDLSVPDLKPALAALSAAGITADVTDRHILKLRDPDSHLVELVKG